MRFGFGACLALGGDVRFGFLTRLALGSDIRFGFLARLALGCGARFGFLARRANVVLERPHLGARLCVALLARNLQLGLALQFFGSFPRAPLGLSPRLHFRSRARFGFDPGFGQGLGERALRLFRLGERLLARCFRRFHDRVGFAPDVLRRPAP